MAVEEVIIMVPGDEEFRIVVSPAAARVLFFVFRKENAEANHVHQRT